MAENISGLTGGSWLLKIVPIRLRFQWPGIFWTRIKNNFLTERVLKMAPVFKLNFKKSGDQPGGSSEGLFMKPIESLKKAGNSTPWMILVLVMAGAAVALGYLYFNEVSLNKDISSRLITAEKSEKLLSQTLEQMKTELSKQEEEVSRLSMDLQVSKAKSGMVDTLQKTHQEEIVRVTQLYEDQLQSLRRILETRDSVMETMESNLKTIRRILEGGASQGPVGLSSADTLGDKKPQTGDFETSALAQTDFNSKSGHVLLVNRQQRYLIVDIGPREGAMIGRTVHVYEKNRFLGECKIERVYETLSAVTVISDDLLRKVKSGDSVFFTL